VWAALRGVDLRDASTSTDEADSALYRIRFKLMPWVKDVPGAGE